MKGCLCRLSSNTERIILRRFAKLSADLAHACHSAQPNQRYSIGCDLRFPEPGTYMHLH
jgi:hypothetical protein